MDEKMSQPKANCLQELHALASELNLDPATKASAVKLIDKCFLTARPKPPLIPTNQGPQPNEHLSKPRILSGCCIYIAGKAQVVQTVSGEVMKGIGTGASQIMKAIFGDNL